jgi:hypothetical protein
MSKQFCYVIIFYGYFGNVFFMSNGMYVHKIVIINKQLITSVQSVLKNKGQEWVVSPVRT